MGRLPEFENEDQIFEFFEKHSGADYMDEAEEIEGPVIDQRTKKEVTTLRLDSHLKKTLQVLAKRKGIRYQTLINMWLTERAQKEVRSLKKVQAK